MIEKLGTISEKRLKKILSRIEMEKEADKSTIKCLEEYIRLCDEWLESADDDEPMRWLIKIDKKELEAEKEHYYFKYGEKYNESNK